MAEEATYSITDAVQEPKKHSFLVDVCIRLWREKPLGIIGGIIVLAMFLTGIFADFLAPYPYAEMNLAEALQPPSESHFLGTDNYGRDLFSRIIYGARVSVYVGLAGTIICTLLATIIGISSGYLGGTFDITVQRFVDAWLCFPQLFLMLSLMAVLGPGMTQVILVLGVRFGISSSRIVRSAVISIKDNLYMHAAVAIGCPTWRIILRHALPNVMAPIIVMFTTRMGAIILAEATLSFLGYGLPPPMPSWGGMLSGDGRRFMLLSPWLAIWPGLALSLVIYGINMLGDAIRDLLDPRLRGGIGRYGVAKVGKAGSPSKRG
ncbi:ABC transporter permease [Chloroflexota bacterium]